MYRDPTVHPGSRSVAETPWIHLIARFVLFFAIVTSFLGVTLSLWDFLSDGLRIRNNGRGRYVLYIITFLPPLVFALTNPRAFLTAIGIRWSLWGSHAAWLIASANDWRGRYHLHLASNRFRAPGGRLMLLIVMLVALTVIGIECGIQLGNISLAKLETRALEKVMEDRS